MTSKPEEPKKPKTSDLASDQYAADKEAAQWSQKLNAVNQTAPGGTLTYDKKNGKVKGVNVALDANQQALYDTSSQNLQQAAGWLPDTAFVQPEDTTYDSVLQASYDRALGMYDQQLSDKQKESEVTLAERGIPIGSEVYNDEAARLAQEKENLYTSAYQDATLAAGAESDRALAQALTVRNQPYNEYNALVSGTSIPSPTFQSVPGYSVSAPDTMTAEQQQYATDQAAYDQAQQSGWNGLFSLGSAATSLIPGIKF
jgi:hypothetical protein